jgi:hypothetical protein
LNDTRIGKSEQRIVLLMWLVLIGWELGRTILLACTAGLLTKRILLLAEGILLLAEGALLLTIHLSGWGSDLCSSNGYWLVGAAQQDILPVRHWVVDELPLVIFFLLVVKTDGGIFAQTCDTDDGATAERLIAASGVLPKGTTACLTRGSGLSGDAAGKGGGASQVDDVVGRLRVAALPATKTASTAV